jgi:lactate dehydrogenase-like 2-hydroxyacid dehydrogenase
MRKHLDPLRDAFGDRLGGAVALHNVHHNAPMTAEMAMGLLLAAAKRIVPADRRLRDGDWRPRGYPYPGRTEPPTPQLELDGRTALVVGLGGVGARVAAACAALGMRVVGTRRGGGGGGGEEEGAPTGVVADYGGVPVETHPPSALHALLPRADALLICVPRCVLLRSERIEWCKAAVRACLLCCCGQSVCTFPFHLALPNPYPVMGVSCVVGPFSAAAAS